MRLTVKNYKRVEWASEETDCYTATLYLDGKRIGTTQNDGHGGPDLLTFNSPEDRKRFDEALAEWLESVKDDPDAWADEEGFVYAAVERHRREKDMKKALKGYAKVVRIERPDGWGVRVLTASLPEGKDPTAMIEEERQEGDKVYTYDADSGVQVWSA
jgi:hypothetical protein